MWGLALLFAQLAAPAVAERPPDIEIRAKVEAKQVEVRQEGAAKIVLKVDPGEAEPTVVRRSAPPGRESYRDLSIDLRAAARLSQPAGPPDSETAPAETDQNDQTGEPQ